LIVPEHARASTLATVIDTFLFDLRTHVKCDSITSGISHPIITAPIDLHLMARLRRGDARLGTLMPSTDKPVDSSVAAAAAAETTMDSNAMSAVPVDELSDVGYACESVLRKRKRKMSKHKMQKRRWKERMSRREFGR
jgi:hypothetical protein